MQKKEVIEYSVSSDDTHMSFFLNRSYGSYI